MKPWQFEVRLKLLWTFSNNTFLSVEWLYTDLLLDLKTRQPFILLLTPGKIEWYFVNKLGIASRKSAIWKNHCGNFFSNPTYQCINFDITKPTDCELINSPHKLTISYVVDVDWRSKIRKKGAYSCRHVLVFMELWGLFWKVFWPLFSTGQLASACATVSLLS